jgi:tRNA threonylcarbamoyladenosine modification (KEOPS) complex  Pcc1 subunit
MITCLLEVHDDVDDLYKLFMSEKLESDRATCHIKKDNSLRFEITANDPVSMKAFLNTILKIIETYNKTSALE